MKKWLLCILVFVFTSTAKSKTIAISYFDNSSGDAKYNALSKGIADMLITDLSKVKGVSIVEREKLEKLIQEIKLGQSKYFDPSTAQKLGKGLGAQNILTGSFYLLDNTLRIDARLVDVQTGGIILAEQVTGNKNSFFTLHQQLATLLSKNLNVPYNPNLSGLYKSNEEVELTAVVYYSNAIELQDQGMAADAEQLLEKTIHAYPKFNFAKNKLDDLKQWLKKMEEQRELLIAEELKNTINTLNPDSDKFGTQISTVWTTLLSSYKFNQLLSFNNSLRKMKLDPKKKIYGDASVLTLGEMMLFYECIALNSLKKHEELIESSKVFISEYPLSMYFQSIKMYLEQSIKELEQRENGKKGLDNKLQAEALDAYLNYLNKLRWRSNLQFVNLEEYKYFQQLYKSQVLSITKETLEAWDESTKFSEFTEFFDIAVHFNDLKMMEEMVTVCKKIFTGPDDEERVLGLENRVDDYKSKTTEQKDKIAELENIAKKGSKEELEKVIKWLFSNEKYNRPDLLLAICSQYIINYKAKNENERALLLEAWEGSIVNTAKLNSLDEAKKKYELLKGKADDFNENNSAYEKALKEINTELKSLQNDYNTYLKNVKNTDPMIGVLENYASIYKENYQYTEEAYTRKQLIDLFKMDEEKAPLQLFLLAMSYFNLGYFDNVKKTAGQLKEQYPSSTYNESISSMANFMPR